MKVTRIGQLVSTAALVMLAGCPGEVPSGKRASATLEARSSSTVTGLATFIEKDGMVNLTITVSGATPGTHAAHIHATGDCSAADATSAMGHWNPDMMNHGLPTASPHHLGDLGNFMVGADGTGKLTFTGDWAIGTGDPSNDVVGKAVIVHAAPDDGMTQQPPGNAGARVACGVIKM